MVIGFGLLALCVGYLGINGFNVLGHGTSGLASQTLVDTGDKMAVYENPAAPVLDAGFSAGTIESVAPVPAVALHPLAGSSISYSGTFSTGSITRHIFTVMTNGIYSTLNASDLKHMGYQLVQQDYCFWSLQYGDLKTYTKCDYS